MRGVSRLNQILVRVVTTRAAWPILVTIAALCLASHFALDLSSPVRAERQEVFVLVGGGGVASGVGAAFSEHRAWRVHPVWGGAGDAGGGAFCAVGGEYASLVRAAWGCAAAAVGVCEDCICDCSGVVPAASAEHPGGGGAGDSVSAGAGAVRDDPGGAGPGDGVAVSAGAVRDADRGGGAVSAPDRDCDHGADHRVGGVSVFEAVPAGADLLDCAGRDGAERFVASERVGVSAAAVDDDDRGGGGQRGRGRTGRRW